MTTGLPHFSGLLDIITINHLTVATQQNTVDFKLYNTINVGHTLQFGKTRILC